MKLACLSGKGGAGKTLAAVCLASVCADTYIDCDVEEPNGHLFLKPQQVQSRPVTALLPEFDAEKCDGCKACVAFCRFHALMYVKEKPSVFPEVCHSCGGCALVCPRGAVKEVPKEVGSLRIGNRDRLRVVTGVLHPGEASGVPVIRRALEQAEGTTVIDCPPGSACAVMECAAAADRCLLIAEPTAFGFHNLKMVHELATLLGKPCSVIVNKYEGEYAPLERFCAERELPILARLPYDPELAALAAEGTLPTQALPQLRTVFRGVWEQLGGAL